MVQGLLTLWSWQRSRHWPGRSHLAPGSPSLYLSTTNTHMTHWSSASWCSRNHSSEHPNLAYPNLTYPNLAYPNLAYPNLTYPNLTYPIREFCTASDERAGPGNEASITSCHQEVSLASFQLYNSLGTRPERPNSLVPRPPPSMQERGYHPNMKSVRYLWSRLWLSTAWPRNLGIERVWFLQTDSVSYHHPAETQIFHRKDIMGIANRPTPTVCKQ